MISLNFVISLLFIVTLEEMSAHPIDQENSGLNNFVSQPQYIPEAIIKCLSKMNISSCFKKRAMDFLEEAINDNRTWHLGDSLTVEKDLNWTSRGNVIDYSDLSGALMDRTRQLIESRAIRLKLTPTALEEGRKKDKGFKGGFALLGGAAVLGLIAQMVMGKIAMIAGAALIFSKIALLISILSSLKKTTGGSSKDQVIYSEAGGSGGHGGITSGWQRSILPPPNEEDYRAADLQN